MSKVAFAIAMALVAACAMGGSTSDDHTGPIDAPVVHADGHELTHDAAVHHDAAVPHDAPLPPDAQSGFCNDNTDCGTAGTCCLLALCVPGTAIGNSVCLPN